MPKTPNELSKHAKQLVRARLASRGKAPADERLRYVRGSGNPNGGALAQELADLIGVDIECLRIDDSLQDILSVDRADLPKEFEPLMNQFGLKKVVDPFGSTYSILSKYALEGSGQG